MEREQLIEAQRKRAIDYWNNSNKDDALKMSVYDEVLEKLHQGLVPSIYHALCRTPDERLFDPLTKLSNEMNDSVYIQLSTDPVTAGTGKETKGKIKLVVETSYLDAFFTPNGIPRLEVEDGAFRNSWTFDSASTSYIAALVNDPAKMVGEDIEVTDLQSTFFVDRKFGTNLVTRRLSRGIVGDCFSRSQADSNYAIVGSPGIGKSWALLYALQQALLYVNVCVLFYFAKYGIAMACIRKGNEVFAWIVDGIENCKSRLFKNSNVLVLLDPVEDTMGGANFAYGRRRLIFAAANNDQHLGNLGKHTGGFKRILSTYSEKELKVALPYMTKGKDVEYNQEVLHDALKRANVVGRVPRYLVSLPKYNARKETTDYALISVKKMKFQYNYALIANKMQFEDILRWNGIVVDKENQKAFESIFLIFNEYDIDKDSLNDSEDDDLVIGYDGANGINYGKSNISIISNYVFENWVGKDRDRILSYWCKVGINEPSILRSTVANLFWQDLQSKNIYFRTFEMKTGNDENVCINLEVTNHGNPVDTVDVQDLEAKCFLPSDTLCRMKTGTTLIDFAGPGKNVYHVAVGATYPHLYSTVKELLLASGHIKSVDSVPTNNDVANEMPDCIKVATQVEKINLYWVIPYGLETKWKSRIARHMKIKDDDDPTTRLMKECFNSCVKQFVLVMEIVPLQQDRNARKRLKRLSLLL
jgi:hypothetical protein